MTRDKQLLNVELDQVVEKRRLDQALNVEEFAVLAGISYSAARAWFRLPGFPAFCRVVFWRDFVQWRNGQTGSRNTKLYVSQETDGESQTVRKSAMTFPARAAQILAQAG